METEITLCEVEGAEEAIAEQVFPPNDKLVVFKGILHWRSVWVCVILLIASSGTFGYYWGLGEARDRIEREALELRSTKNPMIAVDVDQVMVSPKRQLLQITQRAE